MAAPVERIRHGTLPVLTGFRVRRSLRDLDRGYIDYKVSDFDTFKLGGAAPLYPNLRIQDIDERYDAGGDVESTLEVAGLISGNSKRIKLAWREDPFGFDTADEEWIVLASASFTWAAALTGFSNMLLVGQVGTDENLDGRWAKRSIGYRGIKKAGLISRRVTVNESIATQDSITVDLPGGWATAKKGKVSLPRIVCIETVKSTSAPATNTIPVGNIATPISGIAFPTVQALTLTGDDLTSNWPNEWKLASVDPEFLHAGSSINVTTYTYEYVWEAEF